jgi:hypothetical protein
MGTGGGKPHLSAASHPSTLKPYQILVPSMTVASLWYENTASNSRTILMQARPILWKKLFTKAKGIIERCIIRESMMDFHSVLNASNTPSFLERSLEVLFHSSIR